MDEGEEERGAGAHTPGQCRTFLLGETGPENPDDRGRQIDLDRMAFKGGAVHTVGQALARDLSRLYNTGKTDFRVGIFMWIYKPRYFDGFRCAAAACPDSCCQDWEVEVDPVAAATYRALPGKLGKDLRRVLRDTDGGTVMTLDAGRCPMWQGDGLCRIQVELGEAALCQVCRNFPRLVHDYGDFRELGLALSCPEAAKCILAAGPAPMTAQECPGEGRGDYDQEAMEILRRSRETALALLADNALPVGEALALVLLYGVQIQGQLDGDVSRPFAPDAALRTAHQAAKPGSAPWDLLAFFSGLEILTPQWRHALEHPTPDTWREEHRGLARYLVERYWLQAVSDNDLYGRVKLVASACLLVKTLGGDVFRIAQLFSKEIENDADNLDAILDAAYHHPAFTDDKLLGMLLT